jgi:hypothetical protein
MEEEVVTQAPAQETPKLRKIYDYLKGENRVKSPTYEEFEDKMRDPKKLKNVYESLKADNKVKADSFEDFQKKIMPQAPAAEPAQGTGLIPDIPIQEPQAPARQPEQPEGPDISPEAQNKMLAQAIGQDANQLVPEQEPARFGDRLVEPSPKVDKQAAHDYVTDVYNKQNDVNERNPLVTGGKMLWNTISNDLPAAVYGTLASGTFMHSGSRLPGEFYLSEGSQELAKDNQKLADEGRKFAAKEGIQYQQESAKFTDDLVKSMSQVKDPLDAINYIFGVLGQSSAQIPLSVGTMGASSGMQEVGSIYLGGIQKIAQEKGLTIDQVMDKNLDEPVFAATYGTIAALLDRFGAGKVLGSFSKQAVKQSIRARAKEVAISGGLVEPLTEYAQTGLEQLGEEQTAGKGFTESINTVMKDPSKSKERIEALVQGLIGGLGLATAGAALNKGEHGEQQQVQPEPVQSGSEPVVPPAAMEATSARPAAPAPVEKAPEPTIQPVATEPLTQSAPGIVSEPSTIKTDEKRRENNKGRKEGLLEPSPEEAAVAQVAATPITPEPVQQDEPGGAEQPQTVTPEGEVLSGSETPEIQPVGQANTEDLGEERPADNKQGERSEGKDVTFEWLGLQRTGKVIGYNDKGRVKIKGSDGMIYTKDAKDIGAPDVKKSKLKDVEKTVAYNSKRKKPIGIISNGMTGSDSFMFQTDLGKKIGDFFKKQFTAKGFLPQPVFDRWIKTKGEIGKYEAQVKFSLGDIKKSIKDEYNGKPTDDQIADLNLALQGKEPQNPIPPKTAALLETMRGQIDNLSKRFIDEGIVSGDLKATFTKNLGTYLTRSYRKFDDPFWADFVPPEVRNKAESFIRDQAQYNAQRIYAKATRALDADKKKSFTIQKLKERISRIKDTFTGDKAGQLSPAKARQLMQERDNAVAKVNERITRLEDQVTRYPEIAEYLEAEAFDLLENGLYYEFLEATDNTELRAQELLSQATKKRDAAAKAPDIIAKLQDKVRDIKAEFTGDRSGKLTPAEARKLIAEKDKEVKALEDRIKKIEDRDYQKEAQELSANAQELYNITPEEIEGLINYMLYNPEAPTALLKGAKLGSKDLSLLKKRGDIAPEIRALLGEYGDPLLNYARTITKMANLVAKHHFLVDIKAQGMNVFLFEKPTGKYSAPIAAKGSKTMAPLNGLYTTPEIAEAFDEFNSMEPVPEWMKQYLKINAYVKSGKTVFSIMTHARNFVGNLGFVLMNGHYRVDKAGNAIQTAFANLYSNDQKTREKFKEYVELGVVQDGGASGELRKYLEDIRKNKDFFEQINDSKVKKAKNATLETTQNLYQFEDDLYKIYAYENEYARYKKAYPDMDDQQLKEKAANIVRDTYPTYTMVPKIVKAFRANPLLGTFVSFPAEVLRTTYNTLALTKQELSDPKTRSIGAQRLAGTMMAMLLPSAASMATRALLGLDDQDDDDLRRFVAPWQKDSEYLYMGVDGDKYRIIDMGYSDPHSYLKRPVYDLLKGDDLGESAINAVGSLAEPFLSEELLASHLIDLSRNRNEDGDHVYNPDAPVGDRAAAAWHHMQVAVEPGTIASLRRLVKAAEGKTDKYGNKFELQNELVGLVSGQKQEVKDISQNLVFRALELKDRASLTEKGLLVVTRNKNSTPEEIKEAQRIHDAAMQKISDDAYNTYMAAIRLGVNPREAKRTMYVTKSPVIVKRIKGG